MSRDKLVSEFGLKDETIHTKERVLQSEKRVTLGSSHFDEIEYIKSTEGKGEEEDPQVGWRGLLFLPGGKLVEGKPCGHLAQPQLRETITFNSGFDTY